MSSGPMGPARGGGMSHTDLLEMGRKILREEAGLETGVALPGWTPAKRGILTDALNDVEVEGRGERIEFVYEWLGRQGVRALEGELDAAAHLAVCEASMMFTTIHPED